MKTKCSYSLPIPHSPFVKEKRKGERERDKQERKPRMSSSCFTGVQLNLDGNRKELKRRGKQSSLHSGPMVCMDTEGHGMSRGFPSKHPEHMLWAGWLSVHAHQGTWRWIVYKTVTSNQCCLDCELAPGTQHSNWVCSETAH